MNCGWPAIDTLRDAFVSGLFLGTTTHPAQVTVALLALYGVFDCLRRRRYGLPFAYLFLLADYSIDAGTDSAIKPLLSGFWYNDYHRISALLGFVSLMLACLAVNRVIVSRRSESPKQLSVNVRLWASALNITFATLVAALAIFYPNIPFYKDSEIQTPFGYQITEMRNQFSKSLIYYDILSPMEEEFCRTTLANQNTENSLVINDPSDGSIFAYSVYGINMYYTQWFLPTDENETSDSRLIREHLCEIAYNQDVQNAIRKTGAKYVLQLDNGSESQEYRIQYNDANDGKLQGIDSIDESTPGFTLLASYDDIRLYRIDLS